MRDEPRIENPNSKSKRVTPKTSKVANMAEQLTLAGIADDLEDPRYLSEQLITYLGNKRSLLRAIENVVIDVRASLGGRRLRSADVFAGSGVVSRMLKRHSEKIHSNDFEGYAALISRAYLTNLDEVDFKELNEAVSRINSIVESGKGPKGFISKLYAPKDDLNIQADERVFYTQENAQRLDAYTQLIHSEPDHLRDLLLAPLLSAASIHANTGGVFKGFYKDSNGVGKFGGSGADALSRITAPITLKPIILSKFNSKSNVTQLDAAHLSDHLDEIDIAYLDPPYNQHPYGSNYFMLNLLVNYEEPKEISAVSGIPSDWKRSAYNKKRESMNALTSLVTDLPSKFVLVSFSDDGFLEPVELESMMKELGEVKVFDIDYSAYRASRNLSDRPIRITEHLFLLEKRQ